MIGQKARKDGVGEDAQNTEKERKEIEKATTKKLGRKGKISGNLHFDP